MSFVPRISSISQIHSRLARTASNGNQYSFNASQSLSRKVLQCHFFSAPGSHLRVARRVTVKPRDDHTSSSPPCTTSAMCSP
ncbi:hypothetical protein ABKN59_010003 [Abortiporus biennis]